MSAEVNEIVIIILAGTFLMLLLVIFIVSFFFIHQKRRQKYLQEKAALQAQFEQEILNSQNEIQEQTMKHISHELHDNVAQLLTLMKIQLNNMAKDFPNNAKIEDSKSIASEALSEVRNLSKSLNADNLLGAGLVQAINFEVKRIEKVTEIKIAFEHQVDTLAIEAKKEILIFRIFQELLQNILKHSQAKNIHINLFLSSQSLNLEVTDDGVGFDVNDEMKKNGLVGGSGLKNLFYRAALMDGQLRFEVQPNGGTRTLLTIPT